MRYLSISAVICNLILTDLVASNLIGMRNTCKSHVLSRSIACFFTAFSVATYPAMASDSQPNSYGLKGYEIQICENSNFYQSTSFRLMFIILSEIVSNYVRRIRTASPPLVLAPFIQSILLIVICLKSVSLTRRLNRLKNTELRGKFQRRLILNQLGKL
jgi:hypothetical protein